MFMEFMKTNFAGPINVNNAFLPHMRARRLGTIVLFGGFAVYKSEFMVRRHSCICGHVVLMADFCRE